MKQFWSRLAVELGRRAGLVAAVGLILTGIFGFGITKLDFATDQDSYLNKDDQVYIDSVDYQDLFGGQAMLSVLTTGGDDTVVDLMSPENQAEFERVSKEIGSLRPLASTSPFTPLTALQFSDNLIQMAPDGTPADPADPTASIAGGALANAAGLAGEGDPALQETPGTPAAQVRTDDTLKTAERLGAIPAAERNFDNPDWIQFLLIDNAGEIRKALRPFFPDLQTAQIVTRLQGNLSIEDEGTAAAHTTDVVDGGRLPGCGHLHHRRRPDPAPGHQQLPAGRILSSAPSPSA